LIILKEEKNFETHFWNFYGFLMIFWLKLWMIQLEF